MVNLVNDIKSTKVLHIFAPSIHYRFGGPTIRWNRYFKLWEDPKISHISLDVENISLKSASSYVYLDEKEVNQKLGFFGRSLWAVKLLFALWKYRKEVDVFHFHVLWWGSLLAALEAKLLGIPTIYESVLLGADNPGAIMSEKLGPLKLRLFRCFSEILAISQPIADDFLSHSFQKNKVSTIMNCVDQNLFTPSINFDVKESLREEFSLDKDSKVLLFVGSISERKGLDVLLKSLQLLAVDYPGLVLLVVGPKDASENPSISPEYTRQINNLVNSLKDDVKVDFFGIVHDRQELSKIYKISDIFVFPSRQEGLGNVVLEAMASGLPVVSSDLPVLENVILPGENGLVFPVGDFIALTDHLRSLLDNSTLYDQISIKARDFVTNNHSFNDWQTKITKLYQDLLV